MRRVDDLHLCHPPPLEERRTCDSGTGRYGFVETGTVVDFVEEVGVGIVHIFLRLLSSSGLPLPSERTRVAGRG